jgi:hypothetical protein
LNRRKDVELFEAIRREYQFGVGTVKGVARKFGVHLRMVREALADAVPKERRVIERARPKLDPAVPFIDGIFVISGQISEGDQRESIRLTAQRQ